MSKSENKNDAANAIPVTLGETIRQARERHGMSVRKLAEQLHMHQSYIYRVEQGLFKQPSPEKLQRIAKYLGLDYNDLCALAGYQAPELPAYLPYLRAKYDMTDEDARQLNAHFERLRQQRGIAERTNQS
ncbi:helix-turn-helix transcriptional regulator [Micromonospora sp. Llam7]|uniref:helix-turn-helix domain-containing protein n=1 Tax=Micromonospora tarapacensis TaxID=2835305 RepID=UPI001C83F12D|nr:helix-turn-helix transcriptional regulator [Micromonospora tarapacensis]